jgi:hypothetical protein
LWIGLLVAAQLADLLTTAASLRFGGLEANPLVLAIVSNRGIHGYVLIKLVSLILVVALVTGVGWLGRSLPARLSNFVFRALVVGLQVAVGIQVLAVLANLVVLAVKIQA